MAASSSGVEDSLLIEMTMKSQYKLLSLTVDFLCQFVTSVLWLDPRSDGRPFHPGLVPRAFGKTRSDIFELVGRPGGIRAELAGNTSTTRMPTSTLITAFESLGEHHVYQDKWISVYKISSYLNCEFQTRHSEPVLGADLMHLYSEGNIFHNNQKYEATKIDIHFACKCMPESNTALRIFLFWYQGLRAHNICVW
jgi:hypothetical protein